VLRGEADVRLRMPKGGLDARPRRRRSGGGGGASEARELDANEQALFEAMRKLRRSLAGDLGVPPYVVFSDATLEELARERPASKAAMLEVKGVGPKKFDSFGEQFLEVLRAE